MILYCALKGCLHVECVVFFRQAAELSKGLGGSATQQAVVYAFLQDHEKVRVHQQAMYSSYSNLR